MFSIVILTFNEEKYISSCLSSIDWCDDVVVLDSFSSDRTREIASNFGCRVIENPFTNFADQRNFALRNLDFKYDWIFHLDADELFNSELRQTCYDAIINDSYGAYLVPSKLILWGKWLKYSGGYPVYQMRFHKVGHAQFFEHGHGQRECEIKSGLGILKKPYEHYAFQKGLSNWLIKHVTYAEKEAHEEMSEQNQFKMSALFSKDKLTRRRSLKNLSSKLPGRPIIKFIFMYFIKGGLLDGKEGLVYCTMQSIYELMIVVKRQEIRQNTN